MGDTRSTEAEHQARVFTFLADPATHGLTEPVRRIDTHAASVFLAGQDVYKVKRAVRYPFLDFSTLDRRKRACEAELRVNQPNAPGLYLGLLPITESAAGLQLGGDGPVLEWAVHLRRFDEAATLDRLAERRGLDARLAARLADVVSAAHARAPVVQNPAAVLHLRTILTDTVEDLQGAIGPLPGPQVAQFVSGAGEALERVMPLLESRAAHGFLRRCHGDLHLGNIALIDGAPVLFDAIEFDEAIATCDLLYDLAFLLMDLWDRGLHAEANLLFGRYLVASAAPLAQMAALEALPFFLALRAAIRAKVLIAQSRLSEEAQRAVTKLEAARRYLKAACAFLTPPPSRLVAVGGFSGSGKTRLATALAPVLGAAPGAVHLRSDVLRKAMLGAGETTRLDPEAYRPEVTARLRMEMAQLARAALRAGHSVILDATHRHPSERAEAADLAASLGVAFRGLWLEAPEVVLRARITGRQGDASDATAAVLAAQLADGTGPLDWTRLDATQPIETLLRWAGPLATG
ncbi:bifunctional aminoglycoside phosphotransferase/ATP-binding protein [Acidisoma sp. 7E03]